MTETITPLAMLAFFAIPILITVLLGAIILAFLQWLGFRFIVKTSATETPAFTKLLLIQILVLFASVGAFTTLSFFMVHGLISSIEQSISTPNASLEILNQIGQSGSPLLFFGTSQTGLLLSLVAFVVFQIAVYVLLVAAFTKAFAKFDLIDGIKSQIFAVILFILTYGAMIGIAAHLTKDMPQFDAPINQNGETAVIGNSSSNSPTNSSGVTELNGVWRIDAEKSKASCKEIEDETLRTVCDVSVNAAVMATINSDGMLIQNGILQDGPDICNIVVRNEEGFKYSCINPVDRSISGRLNLNPNNTITLGLSTANLVLVKK